jgi:hypothetical protein
METTAGTVAALVQTNENPTVTALDTGDGCDSGFLLELGSGALGIKLSAAQLRALVASALEAQLFDPDAAAEADPDEADAK